MLLKLKDLPKLGKRYFNYRNSCNYNHIPTPCKLDWESKHIKVDKDYTLSGWSDNPPSELMRGREGQILIMCYSNINGQNIWQHYPLYDEEERDIAVFECTSE